METNHSVLKTEVDEGNVIKAETYIKNNWVHGAGLSIVGRKRKANEDYCGYASVPNGRLFVVCDGMGGHVGGAVASNIAVQNIIDYMSKEKFGDLRTALAEALASGNARILDKAKEDPSLKGMGTTACIVLLCDDEAWIAHVGDSRIYLYTDADKKLYRVTKDHSYVQTLVDSGQLDDRMAEHHPKKNVIMKALGIDEVIRPEVVKEPLRLCQGDTFLICSDGLSGMIDDDEIEGILRKDEALEVQLEDLVSAANVPDKGLDNITGQLIRVLYSKHAETVFPDYNPKWRKNKKGITDERKGANPKLIVLAVVFVFLALFGLWRWFRSPVGKVPENEIEREIESVKHEIDSLEGVIKNRKITIINPNSSEKVKNELKQMNQDDSVKLSKKEQHLKELMKRIELDRNN